MTEIPGMPAQLERAAAGNDPRGWLAFSGPLPAPYQSQEDSTAAADRDRNQARGFTRPATDTEIALLSHLGHVVPDGLRTTVTWPSRWVRRRRWLALENQEKTS